jgi:hypothetical protein
MVCDLPLDGLIVLMSRHAAGLENRRYDGVGTASAVILPPGAGMNPLIHLIVVSAALYGLTRRVLARLAYGRPALSRCQHKKICRRAKLADANDARQRALTCPEK